MLMCVCVAGEREECLETPLFLLLWVGKRGVGGWWWWWWERLCYERPTGDGVVVGVRDE